MEGPSIACNVDPTTAMAKIFCLDDGTPISFALTPHSAMVEAAIQVSISRSIFGCPLDFLSIHRVLEDK
jgi:hypothetical protein